MSARRQLFDRKTLRALTGKTADWNEITKDCITFANTAAGRPVITSYNHSAADREDGDS